MWLHGRGLPIEICVQAQPRSTAAGRSIAVRRLHQRLRRGVELDRPFGKTLRHFLAQLDPELVERIDAEQHGVGEDAMFIESDTRAEAARRDLVEQDRRRGTVAWIVSCAILARAPRHQRGALRASSEGLTSEFQYL